ncbi:TPA: hypothetical protein ACGUU0_003370 [Vibrio vulnificus]|nr:hypothetical protein [Vibrio vulnificus]
MGGSSKANTTNNTTTTTTNKSNSVGVGGDNSGIILSGNEGDIQLTQTDHGAIEGAFEFGESALSEAFGFGESVFSNAVNALNNSTQSAYAFANSVNASNATQGASDMLNSKTTLFLAVGLGVVSLLIMFMVVRK